MSNKNKQMYSQNYEIETLFLSLEVLIAPSNEILPYPSTQSVIREHNRITIILPSKDANKIAEGETKLK